jgi:hypothetical protein
VPIGMPRIVGTPGLQRLHIFCLHESQAHPKCLANSTCMGYQSGVSLFMYPVSQSLEIPGAIFV